MRRSSLLVGIMLLTMNFRVGQDPCDPDYGLPPCYCRGEHKGGREHFPPAMRGGQRGG